MHVPAPMLLRILSNQLSPILTHLTSLFLLPQPCFCDTTALLTHFHVLSSRSAVTPDNSSFLLMLVDCVQRVSKTAYDCSPLCLFHNYRF